MPKDSKVGRCVSKVQKSGKDKVAAIKICQASTKMSYATGKKVKKK